MNPRPNVLPFDDRRSPQTRDERHSKGTSRPSAAFTLVELLVVIGLIVTLVAGFGFSLADQHGSALATAQQAVGAACGAARAQAALHQTEARLLIYAHRPPQGDADNYLRLLQVFRADPPGSNRWIVAGAPVYLPRGIYALPPSSDALLAPNVDWTTAPLVASNIMATDGPDVSPGTEFADAATVYFVEFSPEGTITGSEESVRLVLARATRTDAGPQFTTPGAMRAITVRANGAISFVDDVAGL